VNEVDQSPEKLSGHRRLVVALFLAGYVVLVLVWLRPVKVRESSSDKAVPNNLRQLRTGADQYFQVHPNATAISFTDLVGTNRSQYVKVIMTVAGETYPALIVKGAPITASGVAGARTITYAP
jgi:type IV pilus assembly protein PilA